MESKSKKKSIWGKSLFKGCRERHMVKAERDPYDRLPNRSDLLTQNSGSGYDTGFCESNDVSGSSKILPQPLSRHENNGHRGDEMIPDGGSDVVGTSPQEVNGPANNNGANRGYSSSEAGNQQEVHPTQESKVPSKSTDATYPKLPPRRIIKQTPCTSIDGEAEQVNSRQADIEVGDYIGTPNHSVLTMPHRYINVEGSSQYPYLENKNSPPLEDNFYATLKENCIQMVPESVQENPPIPIHTQHGQRLGYLSMPHTQMRRGYLTNTLQTNIQPSIQVQNFLNEFCVHRQFGAITVSNKGGTFVVFAPHTSEIPDEAMTVSIPENSVSETKRLLFATSKNSSDFPTSISHYDVRSDVVHMLPHGFQFQQPVLIRIPLYNYKEGDNLSLMYSNSGSGCKQPVWKFLQQHESSDGKHPVWFFHKNYIFLSVTHFCMFLVVDSRNNQVKAYKPLNVTLNLEYKPKKKMISASVVFSNEQSAHSHSGAEDEDTGQAPFMLCQNNEDVKVRLHKDDSWQLIGIGGREQDVSYVKLANIENISTNPRLSFNLFNRDANPDTLVSLAVEVSQENGDKIPSLIDKVFLLEEITHSGRPSVLGREPTCEESFDESLKSFSITMPPPSKFGPVQHLDKDSEKYEEISRAAIAFVNEEYLQHEYNPMTGKGMLMPDEAVQTELAKALDSQGQWETVAQLLHMPVEQLRLAASPTKMILRTYAVDRHCDWFQLGEMLEGHKQTRAAEIIKDWFSEQTLRKERCSEI